MSCTCASRKLPCPIHGEAGLPIPDVIERSLIVIRVSQRKDNSWFTEVVIDAIKVSQSSDRQNRSDAMLEALCKLTSLNEESARVKNPIR